MDTEPDPQEAWQMWSWMIGLIHPHMRCREQDIETQAACLMLHEFIKRTAELDARP